MSENKGPLVLEICNDNKLVLEHVKSGRSITLYYRDPTTEEQIAFSNSIVKRENRTIKFDQAGVRLRGGLKVCTGIEDGELAISDGKGGQIPVSSDPDSPDYRKDWKKILKQYLPDIMMLLGAHVFESTAITSDSRTESDRDPLDLDIDEIAEQPEEAEGNSQATSQPLSEVSAL